MSARRHLPITAAKPEPPRPRALVFVPARDEEHLVGALVARLQSIRKTYAASLPIDTLLVDDGSRTDATARAAEAAGIGRVIRHEAPRGIGEATRSALLAAKEQGYAAVVRLDADGQHDPLDIPDLVRPILADQADLVWGSRYRVDHSNSLADRAGGAYSTLLVRRLTGWPVSDPRSRFFALSARFLESIPLATDCEFPHHLLLDGAARRLRYSEHPVMVSLPRDGRAASAWREPFEAARSITQRYLATRIGRR